MKTLCALVLDDSEVYRRIASRILAPAGFKVLTAGSAEEAFVALEDKIPDVAVVDWNLPGADGVEFARRLRCDARFARVILVMVSVNSKPQDQVRGLRDGGFDAYIPKPFEPQEFLARILALLKRRAELEKR